MFVPDVVIDIIHQYLCELHWADKYELLLMEFRHICIIVEINDITNTIMNS